MTRPATHSAIAPGRGGAASSPVKPEPQPVGTPISCRATHHLEIAAVGGQDVLARVVQTIRRHRVPILQLRAESDAGDRWRIEITINLQEDQLHVPARIESLVEVADLSVWPFA